MAKQVDLPLLAKLFFKLGIIGFGGPAAHIAMMEREFVSEKQWLGEETFIDLVGATNIIPGPNSTEMAIHIGYIMRGWKGLLIAGFSFLFPAVTLSILFGWFYVSYGTIPQVQPVLIGIRPAVVVIILGALYKLQKKAVKENYHYILGILVAVAVLLEVNQLLVFFGGTLLGTIVGLLTEANEEANSPQEIGFNTVRNGIMAFVIWLVLGLTFFLLAQLLESMLFEILWFFYLIGSILYGSGYVLIAFLEEGIVEGNGWLSYEQLLDAIAIGQFTPGPVLSTSSFIGYVILGLGGAIVASLGIFLPSFLFVVVLNPIIPQLRGSRIFSNFLDAINVAALGLMFAVSLELLFVVLTSIPLIVIAILAAIGVFRIQLNSVWIVLGGAILGYLFFLLDIVSV